MQNPLRKPARKSSAGLPSETAVAAFVSGSDQYSLRCLKTDEAVDAFREEWKRLELESAEPFSAFQGTDWCTAWLRSRQHQQQLDQSEPHVFVLRKNGDAVLVWPAMIVTSRTGARLLTMLTDPLAQYANVIVDRKAVSQDIALDALDRAMRHADVDAVLLHGMPQGSMLQMLAGRNQELATADTQATILDIGHYESWDAYVATIPKRMRKRRNQRRNKLQRLGELSYEVHGGGSDAFLHLVDRALDMKQEWLRETGRRASIVASSETRSFLEALTGAKREDERGYTGAVAHGLLLDGRPIAVEIGLMQAEHYYVYLGAFDWDLRDYSPGKVQMEMSQQWAFGEGVRLYDFLGDPADYKLSWTDTEYRIHSCAIPLSNFGYAYCRLWKAALRPLIKSNLERLSPRYRKIVLAAASRLSGKQGTQHAYDASEESVRSDRTA